MRQCLARARHTIFRALAKPETLRIALLEHAADVSIGYYIRLIASGYPGVKVDRPALMLVDTSEMHAATGQRAGYLVRSCHYANRPGQIATIVTRRAIRAGHEQDFERWVEDLNRYARAAPEYRAAIRLGQAARFQHLDDRAAAERWHDDPKMRAHVAIADPTSRPSANSKWATASSSICRAIRVPAGGSAS